MVQELGGVYFLAGVLLLFAVIWLLGRRYNRRKKYDEMLKYYDSRLHNITSSYDAPEKRRPTDYGNGWVSDPDLAKENEKP